MNSRAVSDVVGFVLVFALITATVAAVYTAGFTGLTHARQNEQVNNAERAFDVLAHNVGDVYRRGAPSRATEIRLNGAKLGFGREMRVTVTATNTSNASDNGTYVMNAQPLVYTGTDSSKLVYVDGAVIRSDGRASAMLQKPGFVADSRQVVLPFVVTYRQGPNDGL